MSNRLHGIPSSFSGTTTDLTTSTVPDTFAQTKGSGLHNQSTVACTSPPETPTAGGLGGIPGVAVNDVIEFDFTANVVLKP